ncbi:unnamed protein product [Orchesella dallaii]|uniref:Uncharacterized protein n=1 Tax=Orchesella dallaii TaxID=48710 RepID=A0ABP1PVL8_9HEXA
MDANPSSEIEGISSNHAAPKEINAGQAITEEMCGDNNDNNDSNLQSVEEVSTQMQGMKIEQPSETKCQIKAEVECGDETMKISVQENTGSLHPLLYKYQECFFKWELESKPLNYEEAGLLISKENAEPDINARLLRHLEWRPFGTISQHLTLSFCHMVQKNLSEATRELKIIAALIRSAALNKYITLDSVEGVTHVYCGLVAYKQSLLMLKLDAEERRTEEDNLKEYITKRTSANEPDCFADEGKAAIKFIKSFFLGARRLREEQLKIVKEIVQTNQRNAECFAYLYTLQRLARKEADYKAGPGKDEENTLYLAWKVDRNHPLVKLSLSIYLSDKLRSKKYNFQKDGWVVLQEFATYYAMEEVVDDIKSMCSYILDDAGMRECVRTNVILADIFASGLPYQYRDDKMARRCLEAAIEMNPKCSSANHKLGLLKLKMGNSVGAALLHVRSAFLDDRRNFPALIDTIQLLMSSPKDEEKCEELIDLFLNHLGKDSWSEKQLASLYLTQGFFLFMVDQKKGAISSFISAYRLSKEAVRDGCQKISYLCERYHWDKNLISCRSIVNYLEQEILSRSPSDEKHTPKTFDMEVCYDLKKCLEKGLQTQNQQESRRAHYGHDNTRSNAVNTGGQRGSSVSRGRSGFRGQNRGGPHTFNGRGGFNNANVSNSSNNETLWRDPNPNRENSRGNFTRGRRGRGASSSNNRGGNYEFKHFK